MGGLSILATMRRSAPIRVPARPARRLRLPPGVSHAALPLRSGRRWISGLALGGSTLLHTGVLAALLQVTGTGPFAARPYIVEETPVSLVHWMREEPRRVLPPPVVEPPPTLPEPPETPVESLPPTVPTNPPPAKLVAEAHPPVVSPEPPPAVASAPEAAPDPAPAPPAAVVPAETTEPIPAAETPDVRPETAPETPGPAAEPSDGGDGSAGWTTVREAILRRLTYPDSARRRDEEGRVVLDLRIAANGSLAALEGHGEGASERLVRAAISAARRAAPFAGAGPAEFRIPVVFRLTPPAREVP